MPRADPIFYKEGDGIPILDWLRKAPPKVQDKCFAHLSHLEAQGYEMRRPLGDLLRDGIYELRPSWSLLLRSLLSHSVFLLGQGCRRGLSRAKEGRRSSGCRDSAGSLAEEEV